MKIKFFGSTMLAILGWQTASAVEVSWYRQPGSAVSIAANAAGSVWMAGTDRENTHGYYIYKWNGKEFIQQASVVPGRKIAVTGSEQLWLVDDQDVLWGQLQAGAGLFYLRNAHDVAAGADNSVWIIGTDERAGGYGIYQRSASYNTWTYMNLAALQIAVDKDGNAWVVDDKGEVHRYNLASKSWETMPEHKTGLKAKSIHTGASGAVWMLGAETIPGGFPIFQWNASNKAWDAYGTYGAADVAEAAGVPWIVQTDGKLYSKAAADAPSTAPVDVNQGWPLETRQPAPPTHATQSGTLLCANSGTSTTCTDTKADYVGAYKLDTSCDSGFYDPIYGGSCWKCPSDDDGLGAYIRSLTPVTSDTACWRVPKESTGPATLVKAPAWAWDCPSGSFWDGLSLWGIGGSCWQCPDSLPRRTLAPVVASNACATSLNQTTRAIFLSYNGCPKPDAGTMSLPGARTPGKPFLDIAAGATQSSSNGVCFACPVVDEKGNFLISDRNANALYDKDTNTGCTILLKWSPAPFYEPGLAYMYGVKDLIWEQKLFDGARITGYLYDAAKTLGYGDATPAAKQWVTEQWQDIVKRPYNNAQFRAFVFVLLKAALKKDAASRTNADKELIHSFATYIQQRKTYLAQQALAMYDAWKKNDDQYRANTGQNRSLTSLWYYGTVPLDFHGTLDNLMAVGATGGGTLGAIIAANEFLKAAEAANYARETSIYAMSIGLNVLKTASGLAVASGASVIEAGFAVLTSIAIDQFVEIETARTKLVTSLVQAQVPVDLNVLENSDNGEDMLYLFWSKAMDTTDPEDDQVLQLAAVAQVRAEQSGYAAPPENYYVVGSAPVSKLSSGDTNGYLEQGQHLVSPNGKYTAEMQGDGNFVIYAPNRAAIWATGTNGKGKSPYELAMQSDGNLVVFGTSISLWSTGAKTGTKPFTLTMQDDGDLVVSDKDNKLVWHSNTKR